MAESAVVASPDEIRGHVVKAFVVLTDDFSNVYENKKAYDDLVAELQDFTKQRTAPYKYPRKMEFIRELPKTVSGKIRRAELRQQEDLKQG